MWTVLFALLACSDRLEVKPMPAGAPMLTGPGASRRGGAPEDRASKRPPLSPPGGDENPGLAFNNADSLCPSREGAPHALFVSEGRLLHEAPSGARTPLAEGEITLMSLATDGHDALLAVWSEGRPPQIHTRWSFNGGARWEQPDTVTTTAGTAPSALVWRDGNAARAMLAWHTPGKGPAGQVSHVLYSQYIVGRWTRPEPLDTSTAGASWVSLTPLGSGEALATWKEDDGDTHQLTQARFKDDRWGKPRRLGIAGQDPSLCRTDSGRLHLGYHDKGTAWRTHSDDDGRTWAEPRALGPGLFVQVECRHRDVTWVYERMLQPGPIQDSTRKTIAAWRSNDEGETLEALKVPSTPGLVRPSATLDAEGGVEVRYVDVRTSERTLGRVYVPPK